MRMITSDVLPEGYELEVLFGLVWAKGIVRATEAGLFQGKVSSEEDIYANLQSVARDYKTADGKRANILFGVNVAVTSFTARDGVFLHYHITGTAGYSPQA